MTSQPQSAPAPPKAWIDLAKEWIAIVGSFITVLVPITWVMGRSYMIGYYTAFRIPIYQLTLSVSDYVEAGWLFLWISLVTSVVVATFVVAYVRGIIPLYRDSLFGSSAPERWSVIIVLMAVFGGLWWFLGRPISGWTVMLVMVGFVLLGVFAPRLPHWFRGFLQTTPVHLILVAGRALAVLVPPVLLLMGGTSFAQWAGTTAGYRAFSKTMWQVRLSAEKPLMLDMPAVATSGTQGDEMFVYAPLYLLTFNEGRYFLFQTVNGACQPEKVYVVHETQLRNVDYTFAPPPQPSCATNTPNTPTHTPSGPAVTPTPSNQGTPTP